MAKIGKITIQAADYNHVAHFAKLLDVQLIEKSQIGLEVNVVVSYKNVQDIYKLGFNVAITRHQVVPPTQEKPSYVSTEKKSDKKK